MCLSAREQRRLDGIGEGVRRSDAPLASMMVTFGRLAAGEPMPEREQLAATGGRRGHLARLRRQPATPAGTARPGAPRDLTPAAPAGIRFQRPASTSAISLCSAPVP
jgi:hypothetical protein